MTSKWYSLEKICFCKDLLHGLIGKLNSFQSYGQWTHGGESLAFSLIVLFLCIIQLLYLLWYWIKLSLLADIDYLFRALATPATPAMRCALYEIKVIYHGVEGDHARHFWCPINSLIVGAWHNSATSQILKKLLFWSICNDFEIKRLRVLDVTNVWEGNVRHWNA